MFQLAKHRKRVSLGDSLYIDPLLLLEGPCDWSQSLYVTSTLIRSYRAGEQTAEIYLLRPESKRSILGVSKLGIMRVRLNLGDTVYVSDEDDHGIIEQFVPYGRVIVRLVKKGKVLKLNRGDVKKSRQ